MYKINDVQLLIPRDGYSVSGGTRQYNEIELLPSKEDGFNTVLQAGIKSRVRIEAVIHIDNYEDYLKLRRYQDLGTSFSFKDENREYDHMIILELEPAQKIAKGIYESGIVLIEVGQLEGENNGNV